MSFVVRCLFVVVCCLACAVVLVFDGCWLFVVCCLILLVVHCDVLCVVVCCWVFVD